MANVGFKLGPQSALDDLLILGTGANATPGSFYLTSDTHRLYIGQEDKSIVPVNEGIITVETLDDLPPVNSANKAAYAGRFYYVTGTTAKPVNVLCIFNGDSWIQLNPDTSVGGVEWTVVEVQDNEIKINNIVYNMTNGNKTPVESNDMKFVGTNGIDIDVSSANDANGIPHYTITFKGDQYTLGVEGATEDNKNIVNVKLTSDENHNSNFKFVPDKFKSTDTEENIKFTVDGSNVKIAVKDSKNESITVAPSGTAGFDINIKDNQGAIVAGSFDPKIQIGDTNKSTVSFGADGVAVLDVYSKRDIQDTLKALNAMTYRGTVGNPGGSAATHIKWDATNQTTTVTKNGVNVDVHIGDTFLISEDGISVDGSTKLTIGTILIAKGTENAATGIIPPSSLRFDVVESTNNTDTTYHFGILETPGETNVGGITLAALGGAESGILKIKGDADKHIKISRVSDSSNHSETLTISHGAVSRTDTNPTTVIKMTGMVAGGITNFGRSVEIPVVTAVTSDAYGHVTGITVQKYQIEDTCGTLTDNLYDTTVYTKDGKNIGIIKSAVSLTAQSGASQTVEKYLAFSSNSLTITNDDSNGISNGSSTTASGLKIDLVWGSFS